MIQRPLSFSLAAVAFALAAPAQGKGNPHQEAPPAKVGVQQAQDANDGSAAPLAPAAPVIPGRGNAWFPVLERDLGTYFHNEHAEGHFEFKNPKAEDVEWRSLLASCQCSKAVIRVGDRVYELTNKPQPNTLTRKYKNDAGAEVSEKVASIPVKANESGEVEVHMEMNGISGLRQASIDIHTTDTDTPMVKLKFQATGAQMFVLSPAEVNFNQMAWNEKREFTVTVTSPVQKDFNITRMDDVGEDFTVNYEKTMRGDVAVWTIQGSYGPVKSEVGGGGVLRFHSDLAGNPTFQVRVSAFVKGPLEVKPGSFLSIGMIRKGNGKKEKVVFESNDGIELKATSIRFEKLTVDPALVVAHQSKDGNNLVVELEISEQVPSGLLRGDMVVELNHPVIKEKRILFNGFVR